MLKSMDICQILRSFNLNVELSNFDKAYRQLQAVILDFDNLSTLEKEGLIQRFEYTFELGLCYLLLA